jgi:hypothetical protein
MFRFELLILISDKKKINEKNYVGCVYDNHLLFFLCKQL